MKDELPQPDPEIQDSNDELYERFSITIDKGQEPQRIDKFLANRIEGATRNKLQQAIKLGLVMVNGKEIRSTRHAITSIIRHAIPHSFCHFVGRNSDSVFRQFQFLQPYVKQITQ